MQPTQALAAGLWTGGITNAALAQQPNAMFQATTNEQLIAMLTANLRNTESVAAPLYANSVAATAPSYSTGLSDANLLLPGYTFNSAMTSPPVVSSNGCNPAELLSAATASPLFSNATGMTTAAAQVAYSPNTVALLNAIRQAAAAASAATLSQQSVPQAMAQLVASQPSVPDINVASSSRKRSATGDSDAQSATPSKRASTAVEEAIGVSNAVNQAVAAKASSSTSQIAGTLAWLQQQQQQAQQVQLVQQQTQLPSPPGPISLTPTTSPAVAIQTAALLRLQQQAQQHLVQQQQQAQQNWAALFAPYTLNPLAFYDQFTNGLTVSSLAGNLTQNQGLITSCPYFTEDGHLIESLQLCRDFQAGKCHRNTECRYVHIADTKGLEVNQGRVTVCRDAAKGRCTRQPCRYYHIPLQAISVNRSHALNSVLNNAAAASMTTTLTPSAASTSGVATASQAQAATALSPSAATPSSLIGSTNPATASSEFPPLSRSPSHQYVSPKTTLA